MQCYTRCWCRLDTNDTQWPSGSDWGPCWRRFPWTWWSCPGWSWRRKIFCGPYHQFAAATRWKNGLCRELLWLAQGWGDKRVCVANYGVEGIPDRYSCNLVSTTSGANYGQKKCSVVWPAPGRWSHCTVVVCIYTVVHVSNSFSRSLLLKKMLDVRWFKKVAFLPLIVW